MEQLSEDGLCDSSPKQIMSGLGSGNHESGLNNESVDGVSSSVSGGSYSIELLNKEESALDSETLEEGDEHVIGSGSSNSGGGANTILSTDDISGTGTPPITTMTSNDDSTGSTALTRPASCSSDESMKINDVDLDDEDASDEIMGDEEDSSDYSSSSSPAENSPIEISLAENSPAEISLDENSLGEKPPDGEPSSDKYVDSFRDKLLGIDGPDLEAGDPVAKKRKLASAKEFTENYLQNVHRTKSGTETDEFNLKEITVLVEKGKNTLETLPGEWVEVRHSSGMPLYLHRRSRVCTLSRPYFLGPGSARRHAIPLSAIPCLAYRKALDREKLQEETEKNATPCPVVEDKSVSEKDETNGNTDITEESTKSETTEPTKVPSKPAIPCAKVETVSHNNSLFSVEPGDLRKYCENLFEFKKVRCKRFKTWSARRKHNKALKRLHLQRPTLPEGVKLITFPIHNSGKDGGKSTKEYVMNPQGKSSVCILHEYVQHAMRLQPSYAFHELENAATPYSAEVLIDGTRYGTGYGSSKKQAKAAAAKETIEIFIPELKDQLDGSKAPKKDELDHAAYFKQVRMDDVRITQMCNSVSEPSPYTLLLTCLQRNFGKVGSSCVKFEMISANNQVNKFRMETGKHSVEVTAANKREGKQLASQALLAKIHPNIHNFGSFLRLYGTGSIKSVKEKKQEEQQITTLQSKATANSPNYAILDKLRTEMKKLKKQEAKQSVVSIEQELGLS